MAQIGAQSQRSAINKANWACPLTLYTNGIRRVTLFARYSAAMRHLLLTPRGAYYADPEYGTHFYRLRTQGLNDDMAELSRAELPMLIGRYIPDVVISDVTVDMNQEEERMDVSVVWTIQGAVPSVHAELATPQKTVVSY